MSSKIRDVIQSVAKNSDNYDGKYVKIKSNFRWQVT